MSEDCIAAPRLPSGKAPITWHPLFPAMVAVWFGALFGLGALAVRVSLLERLALASGIDLLIPAAAPPLGTTARILIALGLALAGGIIGAVAGNLLARSRPAALARRAEKATVKAERAEAPEPTRVPWRTAANSPSFVDISQLDFDPELPEEVPPFAQPSPVAEFLQSATSGEASAEPEQGPAFQPGRAADPAYFPLPDAFPVPGGAAAQRLIAADLGSLSHLELIERLALSLQRQRESRAEDLAEELEPVPDATAMSTRRDAPGYSPGPQPSGPPLVSIVDRPETESEVVEIDRKYGSLLGMGGPAEATPVTLFADPPAAQASGNSKSASTERALRDALAALRRMSGAA